MQLYQASIGHWFSQLLPSHNNAPCLLARDSLLPRVRRRRFSPQRRWSTITCQRFLEAVTYRRTLKSIALLALLNVTASFWRVSSHSRLFTFTLCPVPRLTSSSALSLLTNSI